MTTSLFFLTEPDNERLNIRGSRDPLGLVPFWGHLGRKVVTNLTTASGSIRGFTTLLLGLYFAERVQDPDGDESKGRLHAFLKFEQLAGYVRWLMHGDDRLRGITRVQARCNDNRSALAIGASPDEQILSDQRTYGLWGLYTTPSVASDLLERADMRLTLAARELVEGICLPQLRRSSRKAEDQILALIARNRASVNPEGRERELFDALAEVLHPAFTPPEAAFYREHLLEGARTGRQQCQARFADLVLQLPDDEAFGHDHLRALITRTQHGRDDQELHEYLVAIQDAQYLLVAMGNLFGYLQQCDKVRLKTVVAEVRSVWPRGLPHLRAAAIDAMRASLATVYGSDDAASTVCALAHALADGDMDGGVQHVLAHNRFIMRQRYDAEPWISLEDGVLDVRYRDTRPVHLLHAEELKASWENSFYLDPLKQIADEVRHVR